eukprot:4410795-Heterocapsa_arctica.AAC.1
MGDLCQLMLVVPGVVFGCLLTWASLIKRLVQQRMMPEDVPNFTVCGTTPLKGNGAVVKTLFCRAHIVSSCPTLRLGGRGA